MRYEIETCGRNVSSEHTHDTHEIGLNGKRTHSTQTIINNLRWNLNLTFADCCFLFFIIFNLISAVASSSHLSLRSMWNSSLYSPWNCISYIPLDRKSATHWGEFQNVQGKKNNWNEQWKKTMTTPATINYRHREENVKSAKSKVRVCRVTSSLITSASARSSFSHKHMCDDEEQQRVPSHSNLIESSRD